MKGSELSTILTTEAAAVLNHSVSEALRRRNTKTTPLHVAAVLLSSPSSLLRQACICSHPTTTNPLHSRALDLCFSVALDRLPSTTTTSHPPPSNALTGALKRAQAHLRHGSLDQQRPLVVSTRIKLDQLVVSILDDPSVSRVMREASFSSPTVKAYIEHSLPSPTTTLYINPTISLTRTLPQPQSSLCAACLESYELELALSNWLQIAPPLPNDAQSKTNQLQNIELLMKKWVDNCSRLHQTTSSSLINDGLSIPQSISPRLPVAQSISTCQSFDTNLPVLRRPASPVKTDLVLGQPNKASDMNDGVVNSDSLKRVFQGLSEKFSWQVETVQVLQQQTSRHPAKYRRVATLHRSRLEEDDRR